MVYCFVWDVLIVCNGVKDFEFISFVILLCKIGFNIVIVLESFKEVDMVIKVYKELGVELFLGVCVKLIN